MYLLESLKFPDYAQLEKSAVSTNNKRTVETLKTKNIKERRRAHNWSPNNTKLWKENGQKRDKKDVLSSPKNDLER